MKYLYWLCCIVLFSSAAFSQDSLQQVRDKYKTEILNAIKGSENLPADSVFDNIKLLNKVPAERFLGIMNMYGKALGVSCAYCHNTSDWSSDENPKKQTARGMIKMAGAISRELIPSIEEFKGKRMFVGCSTCHHGNAKP